MSHSFILPQYNQSLFPESSYVLHFLNFLLFSLWPLTNLRAHASHLTPRHASISCGPCSLTSTPSVLCVWCLGWEDRDGTAKVSSKCWKLWCPCCCRGRWRDSDDNIDELHCLCNKMQSPVSMVHANKLYLSAVTSAPDRDAKARVHATCHHLCLHLGAQSRLSSQNKLCFEWGNHHRIIGAAQVPGMSLQLNTIL